MLLNYAVLFGNYVKNTKKNINKRSPVYHQPTSVKRRWQIELAQGRLLFITLPLAILGSLAYVSIATAQIVEDNSLDATGRSTVTRDIEIRGIVSDRIDGGTTRGSNLFHSFQEFNVGENRGVYFSNSAGIENILTRVTGGNASNIQGRLGVVDINNNLGTANLFLINPNGIVFGANARLDLGGSFFASTANSIVFDNGFEFSAANPQAPLLNVNIPVGLRFRDNPGGIQVQGNGEGVRATDTLIDTTDALRVASDQTLALVGGDVSLEGATLKTAGGRIELGSVAGEGLVNLTPTAKGFALGYGNVKNFGNIQLSQKAAVDASGEGAGDVQVLGKRVTLTNGSQIETSTLRAKPGGTLFVNAQDSLEVNGISSDRQFRSGLFADVYSEATGNGGNLEIKTGSLSLINGAVLSSSTFGRGNAGIVNINANDTVFLNGGESGSFIFNNVLSDAVGKSEGININTGSLFVTNGGQIQSSIFGQGNAGKVTIIARDTVSFDGRREGRFPSGVFTGVEEGAKGDTGGIDISTGSLFITNRAQLVSNTEGEGNPGNIIIEAKDQVSLLNSIIISEVTERTGVGNGGDIRITTGSLLLKNASALLADTENQGNAGNIIINARDSVILEGQGPSAGNPNLIVPSQITATVDFGGVGEGGDINISTGLLLVKDDGFIRSTTFAQGTAGNLNFSTAKIHLSDGASISSNTLTSQNAGNIKITTGELLVEGGSDISVNSQGLGKAGNLDIIADSIRLDNQGKISASSASTEGGDIILNVRDYLFMSRNSEISTSAGTAETGGGNGGNIFINTLPDYQGFVIATPNENSDITANAFTGQGGKVVINSAGIFGFVPRSRQDLERLRPNDLDPRRIPTNDITAVSQQNPSLSGSVTLNTPEVDPSKGLVELPETVVDPTEQIAQNPCQRGDGSQFIITGRGGLPPHPNEILSNDNIRVDWIEPVGSRGNSQGIKINQSSTHPTAKQIVPAQGWVFNEKGDVVLTAYNPTATNLPQRTSSKTTAACPAPF
ncbi:MAG: S-layer family protein [Chlorogloeopsis fritschii C42_A2020_084]|uniref:S-layer family protein n=1 Tax=Chlorogloeopsis fritschii TaxID=1124 RepID=UPI001A0F2AA6|nr:S-layer family protein [Chlorogloeopsis fritschii]MBF2007243.1 S-layer family protein [Chlorogloeopsis fritschii C42_A2020_084]